MQWPWTKKKTAPPPPPEPDMVRDLLGNRLRTYCIVERREMKIMRWMGDPAQVPELLTLLRTVLPTIVAGIGADNSLLIAVGGHGGQNWHVPVGHYILIHCDGYILDTKDRIPSGWEPV